MPCCSFCRAQYKADHGGALEMKPMVLEVDCNNTWKGTSNTWKQQSLIRTPNDNSANTLPQKYYVVNQDNANFNMMQT